MIWLTWRQHRAEAKAGGLVLLAVVAALVYFGLKLRATARAVGLSACLAAGGDCEAAFARMEHDYHWLPPFATALVGLPLLAGMFWGAPLIAREIEAGTHRVAWTQTVTRLRWVSTKLALLLGVTAVAAVGLGALCTWAFAPLIPVFGQRLSGNWFDIGGLVPAAYVLFAVALGALLGAVTRRVIPAMAATLAGFAVMRVYFHGTRRSLVPPKKHTVDFPLSTVFTNPKGGDPVPGLGLSRDDVVLNSRILDPSGHHTTLSTDLLAPYCPASAINGREVDGACLAKVANVQMHVVYEYVPASAFWTLQVIEALIFAGLAAVLAAICVLVVVRTRHT
ncbi:MAG: ABC transporter permease [Actinomycetota bacterium]|nr:ABC transporter permease [Actinomycetota bacterium]